MIMLLIYFARLEKYVRVDSSLWKPNFSTWKRMLNLGLPAGGEFMMMFLVVGIIYWCIREFGAAAQAGFGIGSRVMQSIFLPAMAVAFAASPIAGQNFGARQAQRVRETFRTATLAGIVIMSVMTLLCQWKAPLLVRAFTNDPHVIQVGVQYLRIISWNFVATGIIFTCSGLFQAIGNTWPALLSSATRILPFCRGGDLAVAAALGTARALLVPVGGDGYVAGGVQSLAVAGANSANAWPSQREEWSEPAMVRGADLSLARSCLIVSRYAAVQRES